MDSSKVSLQNFENSEAMATKQTAQSPHPFTTLFIFSKKMLLSAIRAIDKDLRKGKGNVKMT